MSVKIDDPVIRPFNVEIPDTELKTLRERIMHSRYPDKETVSDLSQGTPLATLEALAHYWAEHHDWRKIEARINSLPNYLTEIDGLDFHFIHVRSKHEDALPMIMCHGWPGSIIEFLKTVEPLTDPTAFGGDASDAFHLVIPSMPGYGFSGLPTSPGWGPDRIARAYTELMGRLGYERYVAQGGDWGAVIVDLMAVQQPTGMLGLHSNMPGVCPPELDRLFRQDVIGAADALNHLPDGLSEEERRCCEQLVFEWQHVGYAIAMGTRPQSLAALADSPLGLAAFMLDHDPASLAMIVRVFDGEREGLSRDDVLDNITLYWLTNTGVSSARLYAENKHSFFDQKGVTLPVAVSVYPDELYEAPRSWSEQAYPNLIHYNRLDKGGHFAAWEQPESFVDEVRTGLRSLR